MKHFYSGLSKIAAGCVARMHPEKKRLLRIGCTVLAVLLFAGMIPFLLSHAAGKGIVSGSDVSGSDMSDIDVSDIDAGTKKDLPQKKRSVPTKSGAVAPYSVRFSFSGQKYYMDGYSSAKVSDILQGLGIEGNVESVQLNSNDDLSLTYDSGEWIVHSLQPNSTLPYLLVTVDGQDFMIETFTSSELKKLSDDMERLFVYVSDSYEGMGMVAIDTTDTTFGTEGGGGAYPKGSSHTAIAIPNENYVFKGWKEGSSWPGACAQESLITDNPYEFTLNDDKCLLAVFELSEDNVPYIDALGHLFYCYQPMSLNTDTLGTSGEETWYVVDESRTINNRITVNGNVNIILKDDTKLTAKKGIQVAAGSKLTIWCQTGRSGALKLSTGGNGKDVLGCSNAETVINGGNISFMNGLDGEDLYKGNGIGGDHARITINNGTISGISYYTAIGGPDSDVTINDGDIDVCAGAKWYRKGKVMDGYENANGTYMRYRNESAGIGGNNARVTITDGAVKTEGGFGGAGIGGSAGPNGVITISGGHVFATNAEMDSPIYCQNSAAAIGAGANSAQGGKITISGGTVEARSRGYGAGIGGSGSGGYGTGHFWAEDGKNGGEIEISGADTEVVAASIYGAGIGSGGAEVGINNGRGADSGGNITIYDGHVYALSSGSGAGIGGGCKGKAGTINIKGGFVAASAGKYKDGWLQENGMGDFFDTSDQGLYNIIADLVINWLFYDDYAGAGIGCGSHAGEGTVNISGGTVIAMAGDKNSSAVGWGLQGFNNISVTVYEDSKTTCGTRINDQIIIDTEVYGGELGAASSKDHSFAKIEPYDRKLYFDYVGILPNPEPILVRNGIASAIPVVPFVAGYFFDGWYEDTEYSDLFDPDEPITDWTNDNNSRKKTVYAKWKPSFSVRKVWEIDEEGKLKPESIQVVLQHYEPKEEGSDEKIWKQVGEPLTLNESNRWSGSLPLDIYLEQEDSINPGEYRIRELKPDGNIVNDSGDADAPDGAKQKVTYSVSGVENADDITYSVTYAVSESERRTTAITNKNDDTSVSIEKKWDIDLEGKDRPESIQAVVQEKKSDKWETVQTVELNGENNWKATLKLPKTRTENNQSVTIEYRVRELREETALYELMTKLKNLVNQGKDKYDEWINRLKTEGKTYWDKLPDDIKSAADKGYDDLIDKLNATPNTLYKKLMDKLNSVSALNRIVYDKNDSDKKQTDDKNFEPNRVSYHVGQYTSAVAGETGAHVTRYDVKYEKSGDVYKITDKAILEIDTVKRWIGIGVDEEDMPDSAWLVLMYKPKEGALDNASGIADAAGVDISSVMSYEFPVINPVSGGKDPINLISELTLGIHLDMFSSIVPVKFAVGKATKDNGWKVHFVVGKYAAGIPMEYKGAELGSEIIRQIIHYLTGISLPVSYNPFGNYFTIPTKAIRTFGGITDPKDLLDLSKLAGAAKEKAESLTMDDIKNFGPETLLDDWRLMANVINVKIDFDFDFDDSNTINGAKIWKDDKESDRPDKLIIHVKDQNGDDIIGSPIELTKSDFSGKDKWSWTLDLGDEYQKDALTVSEEYPQDYPNADKYFLETDGFTLTNTWHEDPSDKVTIYGQKTWNDYNNADGLRPESITVRLFADGKEKSSITTNREAEWKWQFVQMPKYSSSGKLIKYTIQEDPVEGYQTEINGYYITNTHKAETVSITVNKRWKDNGDADSIRPHSVTVRLLEDGNYKGKHLVLSPVRNWSGVFSDLPVKNNGTAVVYTVEEEMTDVITGTNGEFTYASEITGSAAEGFTITNTHTPIKLDYEVTKTWDDDDDAAGMRPDSIRIHLLADGETVATQTLTADLDWKWTFAQMPTYKDGSRIVYTVTEDAINNYACEVNGFDITNHLTPGKTQVFVSKKWDDENNNDGIRPESVTIRLLADGKDTNKTLTLSAANGWSGSFDNLDIKKQDSEIAYTVEEVLTKVITGTDGKGTYALEVTGNAVEGFTVTNTHTPVTIDIEGKKTWDDNDDEAGRRPVCITVRLKADGEEIASRAVTEAEGWKWAFYGLPEFSSGRKIVYTVSEDRITDYSCVINGFDITNRYTLGKTQVFVTKIWDDDNNHDGIRPKSVTIKLFADGEDTGKLLTLSSDNQWTGSFDDLDIMKDGIDINYTVGEEKTDIITGIDGEGTYSVSFTGSASTGFTVTNKHTPTTSEPVTYRITYQLNGGLFNGSGDDIVEIHGYGEEIIIHDAPTKEGYTFDYWKGSQYHPGDTYTVTEDHTFVAQWKSNSKPPVPGTGESSHLGKLLMLMLLSLAGMIGTIGFRRNKAE